MLFKTMVFIVLSFAFVFHNVLGKPVTTTEPDPLAVCYSLNCPSGTSVCGKYSEISQVDKTKLDVQIRCYDEDGVILKSKNTTEPNPFGPKVYYKGSKVSAVIRLPSFSFTAESDSKEVYSNSNNDVPAYFTYPSYSTTKTGPKSEVEDLNSR